MSFYQSTLSLVFVLTIALLNVPYTVLSATPPSLSFNATTKTVDLNGTFTVDVLVDTGDAEIAGAGAKIKFTPGLLQVQTIKAGGIFKEYPQVDYDNTNGSISISGIAESQTKQFRGKGTLAQIRFKAIHNGTDNLRFLFEPGKTTESNLAVTYGNGDILEQVSPATIVIEEKKQGTSSSSNNSQSVNKDNKTSPPSNEEVLGEESALMAESNGIETTLTDRGVKEQPDTTTVLQSQKKPILGAFSNLSLSPKDWNKSTLLALLFVNVAAIGVIVTVLIRKHRNSY